MAIRSVLAAFHAGLGLSSALLLLGLRYRPDLLAGLVWVGVSHVLILTLLGMRAGREHAELVTATLHKCGFLHTMMGAAVGFLALAQATEDGASPARTTLALVSIGTALLPHFLALWMGHAIEAGADAASSTADLSGRLAADMAAQLEAMRRVHHRLEESVAEASTGLITSIRENARLVAEQTTEILGLLPEMRRRFEQLSHSLSDAVILPSTEAARRSQEALRQLEQTAQGTGAALREAKEYVAQASRSIQGVAGGLKEVSDLVRQLAVVQEQIGRVVESALFKRGVAA